MNPGKTLIGWVGLFGCALLWAAAPCRADSIHSQTYGYSVTVPAEWKRIPQDVVDSLVAKLQNPNAAHRMIYDAGFQPSANQTWFQYPYVLVQVIPYADFGGAQQLNEDQFPEVVKAMTGANVTKAADQQLSPEAKTLMSGVSVGQADLDTAHRRYQLPLTLTVAGIGAVHGQLTGYFGRECLVQVMFYSKVADGDQFASAGQSIADSFTFDPDKAYSQAEALAHPTNHSLFAGVGNSTLAGIVVGVAGGLIGMLIFLLRKPASR
jgi:hypothetical protein